jgi:hypothetical protein
MKKSYLKAVPGSIIAIAVAFGFTTIAVGTASAKPEFAAQTGKACGYCHVSPGGGGKLKPAGAKFKAKGFKL